MTVSLLVDLRPFFDQVVFPVLKAALVPPLAGFAILMLRRIATFFHVKVTAQAAQVVDNAITNGATLALGRAQQLADDHGLVATKSELVATAVNYALPKITNEMKTAGITPASIAERVEARLPADLKAAIPAAGPSLTIVNAGTLAP